MSFFLVATYTFILEIVFLKVFLHRSNIFLYFPCIFELYSIVLRQTDEHRVLLITYYINILQYASVRTSGGTGPPGSYHWPFHCSTHLEKYSVLSGVPPGVERGRRSDVHAAFACVLLTINLKNAVIVNIIASLDHKKKSYRLCIDML